MIVKLLCSENGCDALEDATSPSPFSERGHWQEGACVGRRLLGLPMACGRCGRVTSPLRSPSSSSSDPGSPERESGQQSTRPVLM